MKTRVLTATFPDGEQLTRRTHRNYTHVVELGGYISWVGRPDLVHGRITQIKKYGYSETPRVADVTNDPWKEKA